MSSLLLFSPSPSRNNTINSNNDTETLIEIEEIRSSIVDVFVLLKNSLFKKILDENRELQKKAKFIIINSSLNKKLNEEINLWQAKNLKTCSSILNKITEIGELTEKSLNKNSKNQYLLQIDGFKDLLENLQKPPRSISTNQGNLNMF